MLVPANHYVKTHNIGLNCFGSMVCSSKAFSHKQGQYKTNVAKQLICSVSWMRPFSNATGLSQNKHRRSKTVNPPDEQSSLLTHLQIFARGKKDE